MPLNYSKWDQLELSDDSDIEEHKGSLFRWKQLEREQRKAKIAHLQAQIACNNVLHPRIQEIEASLKSSNLDKPRTVYFNSLVEQLQKNPSKDCPPGNNPDSLEQTYDGMLLSLLHQVGESAKAAVKEAGVTDDQREERLGKALADGMVEHVVRLKETIDNDSKTLAEEEHEQKKHITSDDLHDGFATTYVPPKPEPAPLPIAAKLDKKSKPKTKTTTTEIEVLNAPQNEESTDEEDDVDDDIANLPPSLDSFSRIPLKAFEESFRFIQEHRDVVVPGASDSLLGAAFKAQYDKKPAYAKQCVHQSLLLQYGDKLGVNGIGLFFKKMIAGDQRAMAVFLDDVEKTYAHLAERVKRSQEEEQKGGRETIMLASENEGDITFNVPNGPPPSELVLGEGMEDMDIEEVRKALQFRWDVFQGLPENLQAALKTEQLAEVNKVLGEMDVEGAEEILQRLDMAGIIPFSESGVRDETPAGRAAAGLPPTSPDEMPAGREAAMYRDAQNFGTTAATDDTRDTAPSSLTNTNLPPTYEPEMSREDSSLEAGASGSHSDTGPPISTFVIYTPNDMDSSLDSSTGTTTALRPEDVPLLENEVDARAMSSLHSPDKAVLWVEAHYDDSLLKSMRTQGIGGPIAVMLSPDMPALAIFGSLLNKWVGQAAQFLADGSRIMVMLRPVTDDPVPKWEHHAGDTVDAGDNTRLRHDNQEEIEKNHAEHEETFHSDDSDTSDNGSITSTNEAEETDRTSGVLRLRGGADEDEYSPWLGPVHKIGLDMMLCPSIGVTHRLRLVSDTQFKVQTQHTDARRNGNRPQIVSWIRFSVLLGSAGIMTDRSYSSCGFLVHNGHKIHRCESIPCSQFTPPNQTTKVTGTNTSQNTTTATLTAGVNPTGALAFAKNNISANAVEQANDRVTPKCAVHFSPGKWWSTTDENDITMQSFDSINFSYEALTTFEDNTRQHPMEVEYSIGISTDNTTGVKSSEFPDLTSFITRNQTHLWVPDEGLRAKGRGIILHTSSFIPDIETVEKILVNEKITAELSGPSSTKPPVTGKKSKYDTALSVSIGVLGQTNPGEKPGFFKKMTSSLSSSSRRKNKSKPHPLPVILHEHVSRGWDETMRDWRLPIYPTLDRCFQHNRDPSEEFWKLEVTDEKGAVLVDDEYEGPRTIPVKGPRVHSTGQALGVGGSSNLGTTTGSHSSVITGESSAGSGTIFSDVSMVSTAATSMEVDEISTHATPEAGASKSKGKEKEISEA